MLEPYPRRGVAVAGRQVDPPDEAGQRVGQQDDARCEQAAPGQAAARLAELKDRLGADRLAEVPLPQIESAQEGLVRQAV